MRSGRVLALIAAATASLVTAAQAETSRAADPGAGGPAWVVQAEPGGVIATARDAYPEDYVRFAEALAAQPGVDPATLTHAFARGLVARHGGEALTASPAAMRAYFDADLTFLRSLAADPALCALYARVGADLVGIDMGQLDAAAVRLMAAGRTDPQAYPPPDYGDVHAALDRWDAAGTTPAPARAAFRNGDFGARDYCTGHVGFYADLAGRRDALSDRVRWIVLEAAFVLPR